MEARSSFCSTPPPPIPQREIHILVVAGDPVGPHLSPCAISFHTPAGKPLTL